MPDVNRKALTPEEERALFAAARRLGVRPYVFVRWATETASRVSEACSATLEQIDWKNATATVLRRKGSKKVIIALSKKLLDAVREAVDSRRHGYIFGKTLSRQTAYWWMNEAGKLAKLHEGLRHPHVLRHTGIADKSRSLQADGMPLNNVLAELADFSGHRRPETLMVYLLPPERKAERVQAQRDWYEQMP